MLYLKADDDLRIIVLESKNLEEIKKGRPAKTPDGSVLIAWTPDPVWLADKIMETGGDIKAIGEFIDQSTKRPQKIDGPKHEPHEHKFGETNG